MHAIPLSDARPALSCRHLLRQCRGQRIQRLHAGKRDGEAKFAVGSGFDAFVKFDPERRYGLGRRCRRSRCGDAKTPTGLAGDLKARSIKSCYVARLATDFCVAWTAPDARKAGFEALVIEEDACRGIDLQGSMAKAWASMKTAGGKGGQT